MRSHGLLTRVGFDGLDGGLCDPLGDRNGTDPSRFQVERLGSLVETGI